MLDRIHERARFSEEWSTPLSVQVLMTRLAMNAESVMDPACGEAGVLLTTACDARVAGASMPRIYGFDINEDLAQMARARCFLWDVEAEIRVSDSLRTPLAPEVDVVVLDPPYGMQQWGDVSIYISERWHFGSPSPHSADMAWLQIALEPLTPEGRAYVLLPASSMFRSGQDEEIRKSMLEAGVVEAVVHLPGRLRRNTSIPLAMWCLRSRTAVRPDEDVLLMDASKLGTAGRSTVSLDDDDVNEIARVLTAWSTREEFEVEETSIPVVQVPATLLAERGNLTPSHWYEPQRPDQSGLRATRDTALADLIETGHRAGAAMSQLLTTLRPDQ
jgi:type I restriction-modification system DNA methylase subunit